MGKSGITSGSYHPKIWKMQWVMAQKELLSSQEQTRIEKMVEKKKLCFAYWQQRMCNAMDWLRALDPQGWDRWYDNDNNVPARGTNKDRALLIEARARELNGSYPQNRARLHRGVFIWQDMLGFFVYSKEVGKDTLYCIEFETLQAARDFINGLPSLNKGYGIVLDILPVGKPALVYSTME